MKRTLRLTVSAIALAAIALQANPDPAHGLTVFDPANYQQNLLSALRALDSVNNQIRQLQNQAQMLMNMERHLQNLPGTISPQLSQTLGELQRQIAAGNAISLKVQDTDAAFARLFPTTFAATLSSDEILRQSRARWEETHAAFQRAALLQGQISENTTADSRLLADILARSDASVGGLQAAQAGNELTALSVKQSLQLQALIAAQARAETIDRSRAVAAQEEARQQFKSFLGNGRAYTRGQ
jgi:P-type conjugative transfer protein TrbJ